MGINNNDLPGSEIKDSEKLKDLSNEEMSNEEIYKLLGLKGGIIFLHGYSMNNQNSPVKPCAEKLEKELENRFIYVMSTCRENDSSEKLSIGKQADLVINETIKRLTDEFTNRLPNSLKGRIPSIVKNFPLFFARNSQGALVMINIAEKNSRDPKLNISGIVSTSAPLDGLDIADNTWKYRSFAGKVNPILQSYGYDIIKPSDILKVSFARMAISSTRFIPKKIRSTYKISTLTGLTDVFTNSKVIKATQEFIYSRSHSTSILLICGTAEDMTKYIDTRSDTNKTPELSSEARKEFNEGYSYVITGEKNGSHDNMISKESQLCAKKKDRYGGYPNNVQTYILPGNYFHCRNFMLLFDVYFNGRDNTTAIESNEAVKRIAEFINSISK
ncbi:MAG: hypothetical protein NMK33_02765 [Candidatus Cardinium sp.]|uniref:hypothetical protein n=1 Tax=Cardinium endosymbiont of Dermatophagoides farinae TaxID=2597823 RepID=UPI001182F64D|nr:hypothetical protein [Cardinium endosymbiont of Dermatophagoides farinae]TSJ81393.1 hypothetical protein FPG78_05435 [Cardinium endosymbiont of Dermatophagoides farinae]UWW97458.1 MAG: hypothetical protein NMK33_02765 [Candidatus Cardinium sp.]